MQPLRYSSNVTLDGCCDHLEMVPDEDGTILLRLHHWGPTGAGGEHAWPTLLAPGPADANGLLLWFVVDDFEDARERANRLGAAIEEEPDRDNGTGMRAFVVRDPDGYHVAIIESRPVGFVRPSNATERSEEEGEPMTRTLVPSSSPYAPVLGFSRAVRVGAYVSVGGTAPIDADGKTVGVGDPAAQARQCFEIIRVALAAAGASLEDVVRTRMLLTDIGDWQAVAAVRGEYFEDIRPVDTVMAVSRFVEPEWLVEVEVDAVVDGGEA